MNNIFDLCVRFLLVLSDFFRTTYKAVNVWIFVILWPIFTLLLIIMVFVQRRKIKKLRTELSTKEQPQPTLGAL